MNELKSTFIIELDGYLKALNMTKKSRNGMISDFLQQDPSTHDDVLEKYRAMVLKAKEKVKVKSETEEQIQLVYQFRKKYKALLFCVRNDGTRSPREKSEQQLMGVVAGVSDLLCPEFKMAIEMKKSKNGVQSEAQKTFEQEMKRIGWHYILAEGCDDGMRKVEELL